MWPTCTRRSGRSQRDTGGLGRSTTPTLSPNRIHGTSSAESTDVWPDDAGGDAGAALAGPRRGAVDVRPQWHIWNWWDRPLFSSADHSAAGDLRAGAAFRGRAGEAEYRYRGNWRGCAGI